MSKQPLIDQLDQAVTAILADPAVVPSSVDASLVDLLHLARDLSELPRPDFKARLLSDLERKAFMSKILQLRPGFRTVTPYLLPPSADFVDFAKRVFGAEETFHGATSPTSFHAELRIGDSMLMVGVGSGRSMPATLSVHVPDADATYRRALEAGAVSLEPLKNEHGNRFGCVQDSAGNIWGIATLLGKHDIPEDLRTVTTCFYVTDTTKFIDFLKAAFDAEELERQEWPNGLWAKVRIGESIVAVGKPTNHAWCRPTRTMIYLYVPDADALYAQALQAGATSIHPPTDQRYGDRNGGVTDAWGNQWYMSTPL
jgi:PhnB protein